LWGQNIKNATQFFAHFFAAKTSEIKKWLFIGYIEGKRDKKFFKKREGKWGLIFAFQTLMVPPPLF